MAVGQNGAISSGLRLHATKEWLLAFGNRWLSETVGPLQQDGFRLSGPFSKEVSDEITYAYG